jgi:hypothetical protein
MAYKPGAIDQQENSGIGQSLRYRRGGDGSGGHRRAGVFANYHNPLMCVGRRLADRASGMIRNGVCYGVDAAVAERTQ